MSGAATNVVKLYSTLDDILQELKAEFPKAFSGIVVVFDPDGGDVHSVMSAVTPGQMAVAATHLGYLAGKAISEEG